MSDAPAIYRGDDEVPHVSEEFFKVAFVGAQLGLVCLLLPGRILGSEIRPKRWNSDFVIAACDEAAREREVRRGKVPTHAMIRPFAVRDSWAHMWWKHLQRKSWTLERQGGGYTKHV